MSSEPGVTGLRIELFVRDPIRSARFYERVFGFGPEGGTATPSAGYRSIACGDVRIGFVAVSVLPPEHRFRALPSATAGIGVEIVLEVEDLERCEWLARVADALVEPLQRRPWGLRDFRLVDPDGYYVRATEPRAD
jgi:uncharacterized glyoxalase superfamily protein PhnB